MKIAQDLQKMIPRGMFYCSLPFLLQVVPIEITPQMNGMEPILPEAANGVKAETLKNSTLPVRALDVLDYWFGDLPSPAFFPQDKMHIWFSVTPEVERHMREEYSQDVARAIRGELNHWRESPKGRLALILLLDQFPRRIYRNKPQAFQSDPMVRGLVLEGLQKGDDKTLYPIERAFFYLPLQHAEALDLQNMSIASYRQLLEESPYMMKPVIDDFLQQALIRREQILRFGRFPHRNAILGRESTPEESDFLH